MKWLRLCATAAASLCLLMALGQYGARQELGGDFATSGVGILPEGESAVIVVDYGAGDVKRARFNGSTETVVQGLEGSPVALARDRSGALFIGTWGAGHLYRVAP